MNKVYLNILGIIFAIFFSFCAELTLQPGDILSWPEDFVLIDSGYFHMGNSIDNNGVDEIPAHQVYLSDYYISSTEVTNEQLAKVFNWAIDNNQISIIDNIIYSVSDTTKELIIIDNKIGNNLFLDNDKIKVEKGFKTHPVFGVSWHGAISFCNYLSLMNDFTPFYDLSNWSIITGSDGFRLPTEAEWEYAARGAQDSILYRYSGSNLIDEVCWYKRNSNDKVQNIALKFSNQIGLYDMSGNVLEWCWDYYGGYKDTLLFNPTGPDTGDYRVIRGGNINSDSTECYVWSRFFMAPPPFPPSGKYYMKIGFRIARDEI